MLVFSWMVVGLAAMVFLAFTLALMYQACRDAYLGDKDSLASVIATTVAVMVFVCSIYLMTYYLPVSGW